MAIITDDCIRVDDMPSDDIIYDETYLKYQAAVDEFDSIQRQISDVGISNYYNKEGDYIVRKNRNKEWIISMVAVPSRTISYENFLTSIEHHRHRLTEDKFMKQKLLSIQAKIVSVINEEDYEFFIRNCRMLHLNGDENG